MSEDDDCDDEDSQGDGEEDDQAEEPEWEADNVEATTFDVCQHMMFNVPAPNCKFCRAVTIIKDHYEDIETILKERLSTMRIHSWIIEPRKGTLDHLTED